MLQITLVMLQIALVHTERRFSLYVTKAIFKSALVPCAEGGYKRKAFKLHYSAL